jgi:hypothetical protein
VAGVLVRSHLVQLPVWLLTSFFRSLPLHGAARADTFKMLGRVVAVARLAVCTCGVGCLGETYSMHGRKASSTSACWTPPPANSRRPLLPPLPLPLPHRCPCSLLLPAPLVLVGLFVFCAASSPRRRRDLSLLRVRGKKNLSAAATPSALQVLLVLFHTLRKKAVLFKLHSGVGTLREYARLASVVTGNKLSAWMGRRSAPYGGGGGGGGGGGDGSGDGAATAHHTDSGAGSPPA